MRNFLAAVSFAIVAPLHTAAAQVVKAAAPPDTSDPMAVAMAAEDRGQLRDAAVAYRKLLQMALANSATDGDRIALALLGLERAWTEMGTRDSLLPVLDRVLLVRRSDPTARGIQLRALSGLGKEDAARAAYTDWRRSSPTDAAPYREYSKLLMQSGRSLAADSVLAEAARILGTSRDLHGEVAQLNVSLGRWNAAALAYRSAVVEQPWYETAALFALSKAAGVARDSVRDVLNAPPIILQPRRLLALIEMQWGEARRGWTALAAVKADDSTAAAWRAYGERAEMSDAWAVARDAWTAAFDRKYDLEAGARAAQSALNAGDATAALAMVKRAFAGHDGPTYTRLLLPIEVGALGALGRPAEAAQRIEASTQYLDESTRGLIARPLVSAWLQTGDVEKARAAAKTVDLSDDDETAGWLALYDGALATARKRLVRSDNHRGMLVDALNILARTRAIKSIALGAAFLAVAKHDTAGAVAKFISVADSLTDAAPVLLATAARLEESRAPSASSATTQPLSANAKEAITRASVIWKRVAKDFARSPEAPEALLALSGDLQRIGDIPGAIAQLEALLLTYPETAFAPQGRRALERLRGQVPPGGF